MNAAGTFFRKYIRSTLVIAGVFFLLNVLFILMYFYFTREDDMYPMIDTGTFAEMITDEGGGIAAGEEVAALLKGAGAWAMVLGDDGDILWQMFLPEELNRSYSAVDIARFSRWYLDGYPVYIWELKQGLLVIGYPRDSMVKYSYTVGPYYYSHMAAALFLAVVFNLALMFLLLFINSRRAGRALEPILSGIGAIARGESADIDEGGELSEIKSELKLAGDLLKKRERARAEWINGISHDIRTPLSVILGYAGDMEGDETLEREVRERAGAIRAQGERLKNLVSDLNLTSRLEYSMQPMKKEPLNPVELARLSMSGWINEGADAGYGFELVIGQGADRLVIEGDSALLLRLLDNAIGNSLRHNPDGCDIKVFVEKKEALCVMTVEDNGRGVDRDSLERFNSMEDSAGPDGAPHGNGVKLIKKIAQAHGGSVLFFSVSPHGLAVRVELPVTGRL